LQEEFGRVWRSKLEKTLDAVSRILCEFFLVEAQTRTPVDSKALLVRFQMRTRTLLGTRLEAMCYIVAKKSTFYPCTETLWEADFKGDRLIDVTEDISGHSSIEIVS
jgi:hypothetical protein